LARTGVVGGNMDLRLGLGTLKYIQMHAPREEWALYGSLRRRCHRGQMTRGKKEHARRSASEEPRIHMQRVLYIAPHSPASQTRAGRPPPHRRLHLVFAIAPNMTCTDDCNSHLDIDAAPSCAGSRIAPVHRRDGWHGHPADTFARVRPPTSRPDWSAVLHRAARTNPPDSLAARSPCPSSPRQSLRTYVLQPSSLHQSHIAILLRFQHMQTCNATSGIGLRSLGATDSCAPTTHTSACSLAQRGPSVSFILAAVTPPALVPTPPALLPTPPAHVPTSPALVPTPPVPPRQSPERKETMSQKESRDGKGW